MKRGRNLRLIPMLVKAYIDAQTQTRINEMTREWQGQQTPAGGLIHAPATRPVPSVKRHETQRVKAGAVVSAKPALPYQVLMREMRDLKRQLRQLDRQLQEITTHVQGHPAATHDDDESPQ